jgi:ribosomal biogenesis protein LAS1
LGRFVSGFCDEQQGKTARSNQGIAASLGIPALLVDLRHAASHKAMPSLQELRVARPIILKWLRNNYWEKQANYLKMPVARYSSSWSSTWLNG